MKNNVWYVSKYANISSFGADTRHASFCKEFAKVGYNVRLITSNSSHLFNNLPQFKTRYHDIEYKGFNVTWINTSGYSKATSIKRLLSWVWFEFFVLTMAFRKLYEKPDVIIVSSLSILSVLSGCFYKRFYKSRFIFEVRDIWPQTLIDLKGMSPHHPLVWILSKIERLGYRYSDKIVGSMPGLYKHVDAVSGLGWKVSCIPQGVDLEFYENGQNKLNVDFIQNYFPKNKFIVTYAGTFGNANALEYIVDAARILHNENVDNVFFLMVGGGDLKEELIESSRGLNNIIFAPTIHKKQVQHLLSLSNILVASVRNEKIYKYGISLNKFIDYMYARKPIVCMFSGYPSMINEANCGEFITSENSRVLADTVIKYLSMSTSELHGLGENAYNFLVQFRNFETLSKQYIELFNEKSL
ncbi:MAG: glycosyltransferase involved in cell wall biosynthesis [Candidatus Endobugula sp.]|jgi:glycosyltransferase involved in cell wall biosynthesis